MGPGQKIVGRVADLLRPHAPALALATVLAGVVSACRGGLIWLVQEVLDDLLIAGDPKATTLLPLAVVALFAVQGGARIGRTWLTRAAALGAEAKLRSQLFAHLLTEQPSQAQAEGVGDSISRLSHDAGKIRTAVGAAVTLVQRSLTALAVGATAIWMAPRLALWAGLGLPVVAVVITWTGRRTRTASGEQLQRLSELLSHARDVLGGLRTVQAYGAQGQAQERFEQASDRQANAALRTSLLQTSGPPAVELAAAAGFAAVIALGSMQVRAGELTPGALLAFLVGLGLLNEPLKGIATATGLWEEARGGLGRVFQVLDRPRPRLEDEDAVPLETRQVRLVIKDLAVTRGDRTILTQLNLRVGPGEVVVLRGESGTGKSTFLDVVAGFARPHSGLVLWNEVPAQRFTLASRRAHLAFVDQSPWLGGGTVGEAIALGAPGASSQQVEAAAASVGLSLKLGLKVGDGGQAISGGERQRVALARALVREAPLLLLDEPTAHLDPQSEQLFLETLQTVAEERAVVLVTHRSAPLSIATSSYQLRDGRLHPDLHLAGSA